MAKVLMDRNWQAMEDASTLERYNEIVGDKKRLQAAIKEANKKIDNLSERAKALASTVKSLKGKR